MKEASNQMKQRLPTSKQHGRLHVWLYVWPCPLCGHEIDCDLQRHLRDDHQCNICCIGLCDCHHPEDEEGGYFQCVCGEVLRSWECVYTHLENRDGKCMSLVVLATTGV